MIPSAGTLVFKNDDFGGAHHYTPATNDMPDYPWQPTEIVKKAAYESADGEMWEWSKYQKRAFTLNFKSVGTDAVATLGSIAIEEKDFLFLVVESASGTNYEGTCHWTDSEFVPTEMVKGLWDFTYNFKEVHAR